MINRPDGYLAHSASKDIVDLLEQFACNPETIPQGLQILLPVILTDSEGKEVDKAEIYGRIETFICTGSGLNIFVFNTGERISLEPSPHIY